MNVCRPWWIVRVRSRSGPNTRQAVRKRLRRVCREKTFSPRLLNRNGQNGGRAVRNRSGALLRGLLRCAACDCGMSHTYSAKGTRRYRYYVCHRAQKHGWHVCPAPSIPAGQIERLVIDQIKGIGQDRELVIETLSAAHREAEEQVAGIEKERNQVRGQLRKAHNALRREVSTPSEDKTRLAELQDTIRVAEQRLIQLDQELESLQRDPLDHNAVATALAEFTGLWQSLPQGEQARIMALLIDRVIYDGRSETIAITFRDCGIHSLYAQYTRPQEEPA